MVPEASGHNLPLLVCGLAGHEEGSHLVGLLPWQQGFAGRRVVSALCLPVGLPAAQGVYALQLVGHAAVSSGQAR